MAARHAHHDHASAVTAPTTAPTTAAAVPTATFSPGPVAALTTAAAEGTTYSLNARAKAKASCTAPRPWHLHQDVKEVVEEDHDVEQEAQWRDVVAVGYLEAVGDVAEAVEVVEEVVNEAVDVVDEAVEVVDEAVGEALALALDRRRRRQSPSSSLR